MAKAFRDGFTVPLPLSPSFFALFRGDALTAADLPQTGLIAICVRLLEELQRRSASVRSLAGLDKSKAQAESDKDEKQDHDMTDQGVPPASIREIGLLPCADFVAGYTGATMTVQDYILRCDVFVCFSGIVCFRYDGYSNQI